MSLHIKKLCIVVCSLVALQPYAQSSNSMDSVYQVQHQEKVYLHFDNAGWAW